MYREALNLIIIVKFYPIQQLDGIAIQQHIIIDAALLIVY